MADRKSNKTPAWVTIFLLIPLVGYLIYQTNSILSPDYTTEVAVLYEMDDSFSCQGVAVRSESLSAPVPDSLYYTVADGDKVAKGATVAEQFDSPAVAANCDYVKRLEEELSVVESLSNEGRGTVNINSVRRSIQSLLGSFSREIAAGDYSDSASFRNELVSLLTSYTMASGGQVDTSEYEQVLKARIAAVKGSGSSPSGTVTTDRSGYFISYSDGCEDLPAPGTLSALTPEETKELLERAQENYFPERSRYRIVDSYRWYYVCLVDGASAARLREGYSYNITFPHSKCGEMEGIVESVTFNEDGSEASVVFVFDRISSEIVQLRNESAVISFRNYKGIKVARSSLRLVDGELGVYIKFGDTVKFRRLKLVYEDEDFVLTRVNEGSSTYLSLYDEVITSGKDLHVDKHL